MLLSPENTVTDTMIEVRKTKMLPAETIVTKLLFLRLVDNNYVVLCHYQKVHFYLKLNDVE